MLMRSKRIENKLKILFISQYFPPEIGAAATRVGELVSALHLKGHRITVVTEFPNYPKGIIADHYRRKLFLREKFNDIDVIRTFVFASERGTFFQRMLFYLSFMLSAIFGALRTEKYDIILATSPPLFVAFSGYILSILKGSDFVFEVRDIWPESAIMLNQLRGRFLIWLSEKLEIFLYRRAKHIIVVTRGFVEDLRNKGVPRQKISLVSNGVDVDFFKPCPKAPHICKRLHLENKFVVSYTGNIGLAQGFNTIFECAEILKDEENVVFVLIGDGVSKRKNMASVKERGLDNVLFVDAQPKSEILAFYSIADVCLVPMKKTQLHLITVPAKLYESMACGKPVVLSVDGEARRILEEARAGIFVEPENSEQMAKAVLQLYQNPELLSGYGQNGRKYVVDHYSRRQQAEVLEKVLLGLRS
jgi:glycosyltransferase involved in cell wall biosynthesis